jgi:hypothetical protein
MHIGFPPETSKLSSMIDDSVRIFSSNDHDEYDRYAPDREIYGEHRRRGRPAGSGLNLSWAEREQRILVTFDKWPTAFSLSR